MDLRGFWMGMMLLAWGSIAAAVDLDADVIGDGRINVPLINFDVYLSDAPPEGQYKLLTDAERLKEVLYHQYLNRALASEARELGLDQDKRLQAEIDNYIQRRLALARLDAVRDEPVPDMTDAAREYYKAHYDEFKRPAQVDVSHVLIQWKGKRPRDKAEKLAQQVREKILAGGDFAELAGEYSEDPSVKANHGRLGWVTADKLVKPFSKKVFVLETGEVSEVFETRFGYHVAKVWDKKPAEQIPFEEAKKAIVAKLEKDYREDRVKKYVDSFRQKDIGVEQKLLDAYVNERLRDLEGKVDVSAKPIQKKAEPLTPAAKE
ncbi:peptidylprolyl isomerase [Methylohalobius crimeensis]|uniref:peptidylprolyl isomerase n=1 Tax=Methylohalobius crimeensis TaxID=244365 RepID=UPI0003B4521D|nr:peptidylprolyl isomerase [Methylohalobius crimeensis]